LVPIPFNHIFQNCTMFTISPFKSTITTTTCIHVNKLPWKNYIRIYSSFKLHNGETANILPYLKLHERSDRRKGQRKIGTRLAKCRVAHTTWHPPPKGSLTTMFLILWHLGPYMGTLRWENSHTTRKFCRAP
jgi:hypothetical protein